MSGEGGEVINPESLPLVMYFLWQGSVSQTTPLTGEHFSFRPPQDLDALLGTALVLDLFLSLDTGIGGFVPLPLVFPWQHCCCIDSVPLKY